MNSVDHNITTTHVHTVNNDLSINTSKQKQVLTPTTHSIHAFTQTP